MRSWRLPAVRLDPGSLLTSHCLMTACLLLTVSPVLLAVFPLALLPVACLAILEGFSARRRLAGRSLHFDGESWYLFENPGIAPTPREALSVDSAGLCLGWLLAWRLGEGPSIHRLLLLPCTVSREHWRCVVLAVRHGGSEPG